MDTKFVLRNWLDTCDREDESSTVTDDGMIAKGLPREPPSYKVWGHFSRV